MRIRAKFEHIYGYAMFNSLLWVAYHCTDSILTLPSYPCPRTCPQVTGLFLVTDLFPFHLQARKLNLWTFGFISSYLHWQLFYVWV